MESQKKERYPLGETKFPAIIQVPVEVLTS